SSTSFTTRSTCAWTAGACKTYNSPIASRSPARAAPTTRLVRPSSADLEPGALLETCAASRRRPAAARGGRARQDVNIPSPESVRSAVALSAAGPPLRHEQLGATLGTACPMEVRKGVKMMLTDPRSNQLGATAPFIWKDVVTGASAPGNAWTKRDQHRRSSVKGTTTKTYGFGSPRLCRRRSCARPDRSLTHSGRRPGWGRPRGGREPRRGPAL